MNFPPILKIGQPAFMLETGNRQKTWIQKDIIGNLLRNLASKIIFFKIYSYWDEDLVVQ